MTTEKMEKKRVTQIERTTQVLVSTHTTEDTPQKLVRAIEGCGGRYNIQTKSIWNEKEQYFEFYIFTHDHYVKPETFLSLVLDLLFDVSVGNL